MAEPPRSETKSAEFVFRNPASWGSLIPANLNTTASFELVEDSVVISRRGGGSTLVFEVKSAVVSDPHGRVFREFAGGHPGVWFEDNSRFGSRVNKVPVHHSKVLLRHKDTISLGPVGSAAEFTYIDHAKEETERNRPANIFDEYIKERIIGKGGFGTVFAAQSRFDGKLYAIKQVQDPDGAAQKEAQTLLSIGEHPNIVRLIEWRSSPSQLWMVLEMMEGGSLQDLMDDLDADGSTMSESVVKSLFRQIIEGLDHLHAKGFIYRDLKPDNVLLSVKNPARAQVKLSDFGLSRAIPSSRMKTYAGTLPYMCPEMINEPSSYDTKADVWSAGVLLAYLLTGHHPFDGDDDATCVTKINRGFTPTRKYWSKISADATSLVQELLKKDPTARPTTKQILKHNWMKTDEEEAAEAMAMIV